MSNPKATEFLEQLLAAQNVKAQSVQQTISSQVKSSGEVETVSEKTVEMPRHISAEQFGTLSVQFTHTRNLGNYESAKVSIGVSVPIGPEVPDWYAQEFNKKYEFVSKTIEAAMEKEMVAINEYLDKRG
jgi:hypothetical protein